MAAMMDCCYSLSHIKRAFTERVTQEQLGVTRMRMHEEIDLHLLGRVSALL